MTRLLVVGGSGAVGARVLDQARSDHRFTEVIAPTRRPLGAAAAAGLLNPVVDFTALYPDADTWHVDAVICALGTTRKEAGSAAAFREVDLVLPLRVGELARAAGATTYALVSSVGADANSRNTYLRTKGEAEEGLATLGFASLTFVRPSALLGGQRTRVTTLGDRLGEASGLLSPVLPRRWRPVHVDRVAAALLDAVAEAEPGTHVVPNEAL